MAVIIGGPRDTFPAVQRAAISATILLMSATRPLTLDLIPGTYAICRLDHADALPAWATRGRFFSTTRTPAETSIVCETAEVPTGVQSEGPWRALGVRGPLDFSLKGILASLATPLAEADVSIFVISTYDTDYVLVREPDVDRAVSALRDAGHHVSGA